MSNEQPSSQLVISEEILKRVSSILGSGHYVITKLVIEKGDIFDTLQVTVDLADGGYLTVALHPRVSPRAPKDWAK